MPSLCEMDNREYLCFFRNTIKYASSGVKNQIKNMLESKGLITFNDDFNFLESKTAVYCESKELNTVIETVTSREDLLYFFEYWEYIKLYKYSFVFYYEAKTNINEIVNDLYEKNKVQLFDFDEKTKLLRHLGTKINECFPCCYIHGSDVLFIKFCLQKSCLNSNNEVEDYRYTVNVYVNLKNEYLDIRCDALRTGSKGSFSSIAPELIEDVLVWLKNNLGISIFAIESGDIIDAIKNDSSGKVHICRQMMSMPSGASADLIASQISEDYVLPFIGEIRELIEENEELFEASPKIRELFMNYLDEKERTATYPYVYAEWRKPVASDSFKVKIVLDDASKKTVNLHHITTGCKDVTMGRINDAIEYLLSIGAFSKGAEIQL